MPESITTKRGGDPLRRFLQPGHGSGGASPMYSTEGVARATGRKPLQVPPIDRGELRAFQCNARGTPNLLASTAPSQAAESSGAACSLDDVWRKSLFDKAPEIATIDACALRRGPDEHGRVKIARYLPERFECGRVHPPHMAVEEVDVAMLRDTGEHLMHPQQRRAAHEAEVNARQGELALRAGHRMRGKIERTCRKMYPHGALGVRESPYTCPSTVYTNAAELQRENQLAARKGKGGCAPPDHIGGPGRGICEIAAAGVSGKEIGLHGEKGRSRGVYYPRTSIDFASFSETPAPPR